MRHAQYSAKVACCATLCLAGGLPLLAGEIVRTSDPIKGAYIVVLKDSAARLAGESSLAPPVDEVAASVLAPVGAPATRVYQHALKGFAFAADERAAATVADDPRVSYVVEDGRVRLVATQSPVPSWGLDRVDQRLLPLNNAYDYATTAAGVHAFVIDTGIFAHADLGGRFGAGFTAIADGWGTDDCHGHGTHVSGTLGGAAYGVAKGVTFHAVRVLDCGGFGSWSGVIAGVDFVTNCANQGVRPAVANMSLGGGAIAAVDTAVTNSINAGVAYAVAAGNWNDNACNYSPARTAAALTVGATASNDQRAWFSNWGACVDLFAPGQGITSTWNNGGTNVLDGTSMASPHAAGALALYLGQNPSASGATAIQAVIAAATPNVVIDPVGSPNRLLYTSPTPSAPPLAASISASGFTLTCNASGGTPPYTYRWYVRYYCDPCLFNLEITEPLPQGSRLPVCPLIVGDDEQGASAICPCPLNNPELVICPWSGPYTSSPANQWSLGGDEMAVRCTVNDSAGGVVSALYYP